MSNSNQIPIAETFHSIQGEGTWTGTPMYFIRLAGCPVGKKATHDWKKTLNMEGDPAFTREIVTSHMKPVFVDKQSACQTWDGRFFACDTDFSCHTYKTVSELVGETWEQHVCLTGGEPLIHERRLVELGFFQQMFAKQIMIHYETSGTVQTIFDLDKRVWVAVSPKAGYLNSMMERADEVKYLVDEHFDEKRVIQHFKHQTIFVSPINGEHEVNQNNVQHALKLLEKHPNWRLSCQWHKFLNLR